MEHRGELPCDTMQFLLIPLEWTPHYRRAGEGFAAYVDSGEMVCAMMSAAGALTPEVLDEIKKRMQLEDTIRVYEITGGDIRSRMAPVMKLTAGARWSLVWPPGAKKMCRRGTCDF